MHVAHCMLHVVLRQGGWRRVGELRSACSATVLWFVNDRHVHLACLHSSIGTGFTTSSSGWKYAEPTNLTANALPQPDRWRLSYALLAWNTSICLPIGMVRAKETEGGGLVGWVGGATMMVAKISYSGARMHAQSNKFYPIQFHLESVQSPSKICRNASLKRFRRQIAPRSAPGTVWAEAGGNFYRFSKYYLGLWGHVVAGRPPTP